MSPVTSGDLVGSSGTYVDSTSSLTEIKAAYDDNACYDVEGDAAKCKAFIVAARVYQRRIAKEVENGDSSLAENVDAIKEELSAALSWRAANDTTASGANRGHVKHFDISGGMGNG